jgi:hypothetical protein
MYVVEITGLRVTTFGRFDALAGTSRIPMLKKSKVT